MYVTLYAADSQQIVLDTIKDTETAKPLFINHYVYDFDEVSGIHWESEQKPYDTAIITFTDTQLRARVTEDLENHVFLFSIFWWTEPDDPIYTDGCMEYSEAIDFID